MTQKFEVLSESLSKQMEADLFSKRLTEGAVQNTDIIRRKPLAKAHLSIWRPPFVRDIDKIMHCPYYNRYADKTQVFSLIKNDDVNLHI